MNRILLLVIMISLGCAARQSLPDFSKSYVSIYANLEKQSPSPDLKIVDNKPDFVPPKYIRVLRGSYKDQNNNMVEEGWEWLLVEDGGPNANF
jgi:hypothetical protein